MTKLPAYEMRLTEGPDFRFGKLWPASIGEVGAVTIPADGLDAFLIMLAGQGRNAFMHAYYEQERARITSVLGCNLAGRAVP